MLGIGAVVTAGATQQPGQIAQQQPMGQSAPALQIPLDFSQPNTWVWILFAGSVAYLLGAYVVLRGYRIPL